MKTLLPLIALGVMVSGCGAVGRLKAVGKAPPMTVTGPVAAPAHEASLASPSVAGAKGDAYADPEAAAAPNASLFRAGAGALFHDQRASRVGDILRIDINIADRAVVGNSTSRQRSGAESVGIASLLGLEDMIPGEPGSAVDASSSSRSGGQGTTSRSETIRMTMAAIVTDVLPNGNLVIKGRQEMRVNFELRELIVTGIVRPQDLGRDNTIEHSQIAEARISYGGRGQLTDLQQARWGQQIYEALFPF